VNLFILPSINEDNGKNWTPWLRAKLGLEKWTFEEYVTNVRKARSIVLAEAAARFKPEAIITMGVHAGLLSAELDFQRTIEAIEPTILSTQALCHPGQQALNGLRLSNEEWICDLVKKVRDKTTR
jgi:hypothetical protein